MISIGRNSKIQRIAVVIISLVVIALAAYLFYDHWRYQDEQGESLYFTRNIETEDLRNYHLIETPEGRFVVNDNVGLRFSVPDGWSVEMVEEDDEVEISSPDIDGKEGSFPSRGCIVRMGVSYFIQDHPDQERRPQIIRSQIDGEMPILENIQEITTINGHASLKTLKYKGNDKGEVILIELPIDNAIYHFGIIYALANKDECKEKFNEIIDSTLIN